MEEKYTYKGDRRCKHCNSSISDQAHALQLFCKRIKLADGTVQSCKDDFHSSKRKIEKGPFERIAKHHKQMCERILYLLSIHGEVVNQDLLDKFGINLSRPAQIELSKYGLHKFHFVGFLIHKLSNGKYEITLSNVIF